MTTLRDQLKNFKPSSEDEITEILFKELAETFLYGGYISVKYDNVERYKIFIRCVEFYCHYEESEKPLPKDPIVYHRNGRYVEGKVPYFPLMAFHAHASGIDITFEDETLKLRSSALIRQYEVYDMEQKKFLIYDRKEKKFRPCGDNDKRVNPQSTYLYNFLNGFIDNSVTWVDKELISAPETLTGTKRQNVYKYDKDENKLDKQPDERPWRFTREEDIPQNVLNKFADLDTVGG